MRSFVPVYRDEYATCHVFPFISATGSYFHFWTHNTVFSTCSAACPIFVSMNYFLLNIGQKLINLTSVFITLLVKCFSTVFKNINSNILFITKNVPANRDEMFIWEKNVPRKRDPGFMKVGSLIDGRIFFHINRFWFFNRVLL